VISESEVESNAQITLLFREIEYPLRAPFEVWYNSSAQTP